MNSEDAKKRRWGWLSLGLAFGIAFSVLPFDLFWWLAVIIALGIGIMVQSSRVLGVTVVAGATMICATLLPTKYEDRRIGPLPSVELSVADLVREGFAYEPRDPAWNQQRINLQSVTPKRREILLAIAGQTPLEGDYFHCGTASTCLFGGGGGRIRLHRKKSAETASATIVASSK